MPFTNLFRCFRGVHTARCFRRLRTTATKPTSFHTSKLTYTLLELKESARLDVKKDCAKDVIQAIQWRKRHGIHGGSLALDQVKVIDTIARLPEEIYNPQEHKDYIIGYKKFFKELFGGKDEPLHDVRYLDLKSYVHDHMTTSEDLSLLFYHPYYHAEEDALEFIPTALYVLENLNGKVFPLPPPRGTFDQATNKSGKCEWQVAYKALSTSEKVDILESINTLPENYRLGFESLFFKGKNDTPYNNTDPYDELIFYKNVCAHISEHMTIASRTDLYQALCQAFPQVPKKMFKFLWTYQGYHSGFDLHFTKI